jgi:hypothetical protein
VFVDQYGDEEDPRLSRYGETYHLRRWLAPGGDEAARQRQLIELRHLRIEQLDRAALADARLVALAGVSAPETTVPLLREYVEQGGNVLIAAGGDFDPAAWTEAAWLGGLGILPAPLEAAPAGRLPEQSPAKPEWFFLDFDSLKDHEFFALEGTSQQDLEDLYREPCFFKAVVADVDRATEDAAVKAIAAQLADQRRDLERIDRRLAELGGRELKGKLSAAERSELDGLKQQRERLRPSWLQWAADDQSAEQRPVEELAEATRPMVLARYGNGLPFMVERRLGRGRVLLMTTGVFPEWNTLALTNAVVVFDRVLRGMIDRTLPKRNLSTERSLALPVSDAERSARFALLAPDGPEAPLAVDAIGADRYGVTVKDLTHRGVYRVVASRAGDGSAGSLDTKLWNIPLGVNGPEEESRLASSESRQMRQRMQQAAASQATRVTVAGLGASQIETTEWWKWLAAAALACLLLELLILALSSRSGGPAK